MFSRTAKKENLEENSARKPKKSRGEKCGEARRGWKSIGDKSPLTVKLSNLNP